MKQRHDQNMDRLADGGSGGAAAGPSGAGGAGPAPVDIAAARAAAAAEARRRRGEREEDSDEENYFREDDGERRARCIVWLQALLRSNNVPEGTWRDVLLPDDIEGGRLV